MRAQRAAQYNEVVIAASEWTAHLPDAVHAIIYGPALQDSPGVARAAHAHFLQRWRRSARQTPLLFFNPANKTMPFACRDKDGC